MTTDFRALCAELLQELCCHYRSWELKEGIYPDAMKRANAALAEPEPVAEESSVAQPADGEVAELVAWLRKTSSAAFMDGWPNEESINIDRAADLLERLSPPQPVPVSERLPGPEDCDERARCWWLTLDWAGPALWIQTSTPTHWLPANALPLPS